MPNLDIPYTYLEAIARKVYENFDHLSLAGSRTACDTVKNTINVAAVGTMPADQYSDEERAILATVQAFPLDKWLEHIEKGKPADVIEPDTEPEKPKGKKK